MPQWVYADHPPSGPHTLDRPGRPVQEDTILRGMSMECWRRHRRLDTRPTTATLCHGLTGTGPGHGLDWTDHQPTTMCRLLCFSLVGAVAVTIQPSVSISSQSSYHCDSNEWIQTSTRSAPHVNVKFHAALPVSNEKHLESAVWAVSDPDR